MGLGTGFFEKIRRFRSFLARHAAARADMDIECRVNALVNATDYRPAERDIVGSRKSAEAFGFLILAPFVVSRYSDFTMALSLSSYLSILALISIVGAGGAERLHFSDHRSSPASLFTPFNNGASVPLPRRLFLSILRRQNPCQRSTPLHDNSLPSLFLPTNSLISKSQPTMPGTAILSPGVGYAIVLAISLGFAVLMVGITKLQERYTKFKQSSLAEFASASHSVKPGLIACAIVSSWTWSSTLLTSSAQSFSQGMVGGWAYGAGTPLLSPGTFLRRL